MPALAYPDPPLTDGVVTLPAYTAAGDTSALLGSVGLQAIDCDLRAADVYFARLRD